MENGELKAVLKNFPVPLDFSVRPQSQGYINLSYALYYEGTPRFLLQQINTRVFSNIETVINNLVRALPYLKDPQYPGPNLIQTRTGQPVLRMQNGNCWRLLTYVPDSHSFLYCPDAETAREAGKILGVFHQLMDKAIPDEFEESLPGFHHLNLRIKQFESALSKADPDRKIKAEKAITYARNMAPTLSAQKCDSLPLRVCHNDTKMSNFLFSKTDGKGLCLVDLDTIMPTYFHYDFGDALRTIANAAPEEETDPDKIVFNRPYCEAFIAGLSSTASFLTREEIGCLAYGLQLMPFLHGIRALTDYLSGDVYYRVQYARQNLDRSLGLFQFTSLVEKEMPFLKEVVSKYFPPD